jgi:hypothetical protein
VLNVHGAAGLARAVSCMDEGALEVEQLAAMKEFLPQPDEASKIASFMSGGGSADALGRAEKYMHAMLSVPKAALRLGVMDFNKALSGRVGYVQKMVGSIECACDDVKMSAALKKVLKTILKVGNQMNDGESQGFKVHRHDT